MTLIVGAVDTEAGTVHLAGDTKITWDGDPTRSRKIYNEPALKVIRLCEDLAVGYAGAGPDTLAREIAKLCGLDSKAVLRNQPGARRSSLATGDAPGPPEARCCA